MNLRPYQEKVVSSVLNGFNEFEKQLVVVPTGGGKTICFAKLAEAIQPKRTLILAHREELIDQAIQKLHQATGIYAEKEKAEFSARPSAPVVVASVQTMIRRLDKWRPDHFGLVVADEAHHAISDSWQKVLRHFTGAWVLGVTATPDRGDARNLGSYFENIAAEVSLLDLINDGYLSRICVKSIPLKIDLGGVRQTAGDFNESDLGDALAPYLRSIAQVIRDEAAFRRTLVFLPLIATSKEFTRLCVEEGLNACHIDGTSEDRKEILTAFAEGEYDVLCNAMLLTEGFDDPGIDCVVILRPTRSRALYCQMTGRGTRVAPSKSNLLLLDFLYQSETHSLIRPAHLIAQSEEIANEMTAIVQERSGGESQEMLDLQGLASEAQIKREEKLRAELAKKAKRKARTIDAMDFALSLHCAEAAEYEPVCNWERKDVTAGQRAVLERAGIDLESVQNAGHASKLIDLIISRSKMGMATPKQMRMLRQFGHPTPERATFEQAKAFLDRRFGRKETVTV